MRRSVVTLLVLAACADADGDGASGRSDCDDADARANPDATEVCNGIDDDCDGQIDEDVAIVAWQDRDGDGFGDPERVRRVCQLPDDGVTNADDCDDLHAAARPGGEEVCDGLDGDCDGQVDEDVEESFFPDADGDGHGVAGEGVSGCFVGAGYARVDDDCDDGEPLAWTDAPEACDGVDNDCDAVVDEGLDEAPLHPDADGDGFGDPDAWVGSCGEVPGATPDDGDCDDGDADVGPGAGEVASNGVDDDCDGRVDERDLEVPGAYATIDAALAAARDGDVIHLAPGWYTGTIDLRGEDVVLKGSGCGRTVLYGNTDGAVLRLDGGLVEDLSVRGGLDGGVEVTGDVTARRICVEGNQSGYDGGGILVAEGTLDLWDSRIHGNSSRLFGGGVAVGRQGVLQASRIDVRGNYGRQDGGGLAVAGGEAFVTNAVIAGNVSDSDGGGVVVRADPIATTDAGRADLHHVTLVGNRIPRDERYPSSPQAEGSAIQVGVGEHADPANPHPNELVLTSSVVVGNGPSFESPIWADIYTLVTIEDVALWGNGGADLRAAWQLDAVRVPPAFVAFDADQPPETWDLRLRPDSGLRDRLDGLEEDPDATAADLGAYGGNAAGPGWDAGDPDAPGADLDDDGLADAWELAHGLHPWEDDAGDDVDGDGLTALVEQALDTLPLVADTDGDGVDDGTELAELADPRRPDQAPVAVIAPLGEALPGDAVQLDGSGSFDLQDLTVDTTWSLVSRPAGSSAAVRRPAGPVATLDVDLPGTYVVALDVADHRSTTRATATIVVPDAIVVPDDAASIAEALDLAGPGDVIALRAGTWVGPIAGGDLDLTVVGLEPGVVIEPAPLAPGGTPIGSAVSWVGDADLTLRHLTLARGNAAFGGGLYCEACTGAGCDAVRPTVRLVDVEVVDSKAVAQGGGLYLEGCNLDAERLVVADNEADQGGGLATFETNVRLVDVAFRRNVAEGAGTNSGQGGALRLDQNTFVTSIRNAVFQDNHGIRGGSVFFRASEWEPAMGWFEQVVFADETATESLVRVGDGRIVLVDAMFVGSSAPSLVDLFRDAEAWLLAPLVFECTGELLTGDDGFDLSEMIPVDVRDVDPGVVRRTGDADLDLWTLAPGSPLIDAGFAERRDVDGSLADFGLAGGPSAPVSLRLDSLDRDADAMSDGWEHRFGLNRFFDDADEDADGDGLSNLDEYLAGTRPDLAD